MKIHFGLIVAATLFYLSWDNLLWEQVLNQSGSDHAFFAHSMANVIWWRLANLGRYAAFVTLVLGHAICFPKRPPKETAHTSP